MRENIPELNDAQLCMLNESHQNQLGVLSCPEWTPFGYEAQEEKIEKMDTNESDQQNQLTVDMDWN